MRSYLVIVAAVLGLAAGARADDNPAESDGDTIIGEVAITVPDVRPVNAHGKDHEVKSVKWFDSDDVQSEATYEFGVRNGSYRTFYKGGQVQEEGVYEDGLRVGTWKAYDAQGELQFEFAYELGVRSGERVQYVDGHGPAAGRRVVFLREHYLYGLLEGLSESYSVDDTRVARGYYRAGNKEGTWEYFRADGTVSKTKTFSCGREASVNADFPTTEASCKPQHITLPAPQIVKRPGETNAELAERIAKTKAYIQKQISEKPYCNVGETSRGGKRCIKYFIRTKTATASDPRA